ncbi:MAG TPA: hypothetical protein VFZ70_13065 [Euzebyales bacterium]
MIVMAAVGAAVLAMVSWVALREAQRLPGTSASRHDRAHAARPTSPRPRAPRVPSAGARSAEPWRVHVVGDATLPGADTHEALAAAAALWHVLVDAEAG